MSSKVVTQTEVRLSYENLITPRAQNEGDEPTFSTMILVPKSDTATVESIKGAIKSALDDGVASKWNGKRPANLKHPLRDGDVERPDDPNAKGMWFFNAKGPGGGKEAPFLYGKNGNLIEPTGANAAQAIYSGVHGRVSLNFYPYDRNGNRGVAAGIVAFLSNEHGERLDSRPTANSALAEFGIDPLAASADEEEKPSENPSTALPSTEASASVTTVKVDADEDPWG